MEIEKVKRTNSSKQFQQAYQGIFERLEKKYLLKQEQYEALKPLLRERMEPDPYGRSLIMSLYFDTPDHLLIRRSLEKPAYKEKLRLRSYGVPGPKTQVYAELKKKFSGVVYKRREAMTLEEAEAYLLRKREPSAKSQIIRELDWMLSFYEGITPAALISCQREAFFSKESSLLRMTFDENILWREENLSLSEGEGGLPLLQEGERLLEIKIPGAMPLWLASALDSLKAFPVSFSKYGNAYKASFARKNEKHTREYSPLIMKEDAYCA